MLRKSCTVLEYNTVRISRILAWIITPIAPNAEAVSGVWT
jgi:hypothetical protein